MDNRKIEYFLKVCETGSMAKAARSYYVSQQALSKSIETLEEELGVPLFIRTRGGLSLTEQGLFLRNESIKLKKQQDDLVLHLAEMSEACRKSFRMSYFNGMLSLFPDGFLEALIQSQGDTNCHFYSYQDDDHGRLFANTNVDLFFATVPMQLPGLEKVIDMHAHMSVLVGSSHRLAGRGSIRIEDLRGESIIALNTDAASINLLKRAFSPHGIVFHSVLGISDQSLQHYLVKNQNAVTFFAGPDRLCPEGTVKLELSNYDLDWPMYVYQRRHNPNKTSDEILQAIRNFYSI